MRTLIGMSGGVDSAVTAAIVSQSDYAEGITLQLYDGGKAEIINKLNKEAADAASVCEKIGIKHNILQLKELFKKYVIVYFVSEYISGRTPNPCIQCNINIKFGAMLDYAIENGFDKIATGHYARVEKCGDKYLLKKALDGTKDQSYVLYGLTQNQLSRTVFPLGTYTKKQTRQTASDLELSVARKSDSQDICFIPDGDYAAFIENIVDKKFDEGDFLSIDGEVLGRHKGIIHYTIGQRKGLGIALGHPAFVIQKDAQTNRVVLGDEKYLFFKKVEISGVNLTAAENLDGVRAAAKLRYRHTEQPCVIHQTDKDRVVLEFDKPQRAPSAGQGAVIYDGDIVLGGGTIERGIE